jgi:NitT/TauT family transport system substrate-binding protein
MKALAALAGISILALTGCSTGGAQPADDGGLIPIDVSIGTAAGGIAPMYLAVENGVFSDLGLDVRLHTATSGSLAVPTILADQFQFAFTSFDSYLDAFRNGLPVTMVGSSTRLISPESGYYGIIVAADSTATDMSQVKTLATPDTAKTAILDLLVTGLGGDYENMQQLAAPLGSIGDTVASGAADAGYLFQPFLQQAVDTGKVKVLSAGTDDMTFVDAPAAVVIAKNSYLADNESTAAKFAEGLRQAYAYASENLEEISAYTLSAGLAKNAVPVKNLPNYSDDLDSLSLMQKELDAYHELGYLDEPIKADEIVWAPGGGFTE